jgi:hypothetical protein
LAIGRAATLFIGPTGPQRPEGTATSLERRARSVVGISGAALPKRAMVASAIANIKFSQFVRNQHEGSAILRTPPISNATAAKMLNVGLRIASPRIALYASRKAGGQRGK